MGCWIGTKNSKTTNAATTDTKILLFYVNIWTTKLLPVPVPCSFKKKQTQKYLIQQLQHMLAKCRTVAMCHDQ
jgi:hypothetical protein